MPEDPKQQEEQIKKIVEQALQEQMKKNGKLEPSGSKLSPEDSKAVVDCTNAHNVTLQTLRYSEEQGGKFSDPENLNIIQDCADICQLVNSMVLRQSSMKKDIAEVCKKACDACVKFAENFSEDEQMKTMLEYAKKASESVKQIK